LAWYQRVTVSQTVRRSVRRTDLR